MPGGLERIHISVGSYPHGEAQRVSVHATKIGVPHYTVRGPRENFLLEDGITKLSIPRNQTAVVVIPNGPETLERFWEDFKFPDEQ